MPLHLYTCVHISTYTCVCIYVCMFVYLGACDGNNSCEEKSYATINIRNYIKTSGSELRPKKVELVSTHKKRDDYREYFTHNNKACKNPYKTTLPY